ncbi:MAG TPA: LytTR family DNA-binding domain-containing protein [Trebonia sp.]|jgi:DNA-binding LytR/AlgR family response regulator|nr:LytTR family DNA-binding domain-containing protein [Trebonia sp.]
MRPRVAALVADDEEPALEDLRYLLRTAFGVAVVDAARDSSEVFRRVQQRSYDVVFLDVKMPGLNGIEVASVLRQFAAPPAVVVVTAHEEYAVRAFDVGVCDYLLKPVVRARLGVALDRALSSTRVPAPGAARMQAANGQRLPAVRPSGGYPTTDDPTATIPVETGGRTRFVSREDVRWVEAQGDYVRLHMADGEAHLVRMPISRLEEMWAESGFIRIHRGYLVPFKHVTEFSAVGGNHTVTVAGHALPVSRRHVRGLRDRILRAGWRV